jgi:hypothetical protein
VGAVTAPLCAATSPQTARACDLPSEDPHLNGHRASNEDGSAVRWANNTSPEQVEPAR